MNFNEMIMRLTMMRALIIGFFFMSLFYFFAYDNGSTQLAAIQSAQNSIAQNQKDLQAMNEKLEHAKQYQKSAAEMGDTLNRLLSYIPENFRLQDFMKMVSEEAKVAGLNIVHVTDSGVAPPAQGAEFEELTVTVSLEGTFAQNMTFLSNLTKQKQIFTVEQFGLSKASGIPTEIGVPLLGFSAAIKAYRYIGGKPKS